MSDIQTCTWQGASGQRYEYEIYPISTEFNAAPGNYIFAKLSSQNRWFPVYIGQTDNFLERFGNHHAAECIKRNGATHIHAHRNDSRTARLAEESDLLAAHNPPCNG